MKKVKLSAAFMLLSLGAMFYPQDKLHAQAAWDKEYTYTCYGVGYSETTGTYCGAGGGGCTKNFCG